MNTIVKSLTELHDSTGRCPSLKKTRPKKVNCAQDRDLKNCRIALLAQSSIPDHAANSIQVFRMAEALTQLGHSVTLFAPTKRCAPSFRETIGYDRMFQFQAVESKGGYVGLFVSIFRLTRRIRLYRPDLILSRSPLGSLLLLSSGIPMVLEVHAFPSIRTRNPSIPRAIMLRIIFLALGVSRMPIAIVVLSDAARTVAARRRLFGSGRTLHVIPSAGSRARGSSLPRGRQTRQSEKPLLGYFGSSSTGKGLDFVVRLAVEMSEVDFVVAGARVRLPANSPTNLTSLGILSHEDALAKMLDCDGLLAPYGEQVLVENGVDITLTSSPMKLYDYALTGRTIFASDVTMVREILTDDEAILLRADDVAAWKHEILQWMSFPRPALQFETTTRVSNSGTYRQRAMTTCRVFAQMQQE